ncbi:L-glutaminase [Sinobacterium caligoides]|uniref:Glutaminase n=1 Tax=Sinobacterium caligoides TaxID=933926 RepID=A0A3N2DE44_9GAMM|nr:glutaminase [Sinobacterium caligoides]ROR97928.1 L-glutaminase [Sinobacterium caligoides]
MINIDYQAIFHEVVDELAGVHDRGEVADYIPGLADVDPNKLGIHLTTIDNQQHSYGDFDERFSIQSISKVLTLTLAMEMIGGDNLWKRVGIEPSGSAFNSLVQLEYERGMPRNPFINAGAIVICDVLVSCLDNPKQDLLDFIRRISGNQTIDYCAKTAEMESETGFRNYALINLMRDFGNIHNDIETVLDLYFYSCSITMSCKELSETFMFLAAYGTNPMLNTVVVNPTRAQRINSIMQLCGFYDEAGEFSFRVGLPGKSGVGGGIIAVHPGRYSVAVWSPRLNKKGNSYKGMLILEGMTTKSQTSIF